jgi:hypothetical protein
LASDCSRLPSSFAGHLVDGEVDALVDDVVEVAAALRVAHDGARNTLAMPPLMARTLIASMAERTPHRHALGTPGVGLERGLRRRGNLGRDGEGHQGGEAGASGSDQRNVILVRVPLP